MDPARRAEILRRYELHTRRFERDAANRRRRGLSSEVVGEVDADRPLRETITPSELRVLELIAEGCTDQQIAEREGLSEFTVKRHVGSLYRRLPARNRPHAVAVGVKNGFLKLREPAA